MKIALFGASGLIGTHLQKAWGKKYEILAATHRPGDALFWDPAKGILDPEEIEDVDLIINMAGENIATGRWTKEKKRRILESRTQSAALIARAVHGLKRPPKVWIQASATGYYGNRGDEELDERSLPGEGFLADVCKQWEQAAGQVGDAIRLIRVRFGVVLSKEGGALQKMLPAFRLGLGGKIGSGRQWMSWIALEEIPSIFEHLYFKGISGPVNVVAPHGVRNRDFTKLLAEKLHRPALLPMPSFVAKLVLGEMADELLLSSANVLPKVLLESGYTFRHGSLDQVLS